MNFRLILILTLTVATASCARQSVASEPVVPAPAFVSDNPNSIYAADPNDSWNRIFRGLFTRNIKHRVSNAYPEGAPFAELHGLGIGITPLRFSRKEFSRTELGDRAIEPLYPAFFTNEGPSQILREPRYSEFTAALREATDETKVRTPIERALMQADAWAAYDLIYRMRRGSPASDPEGRLLALLRQLIRKLALSTDELKSLKNNYLVAASGNKLPDLFSRESGWLEIELLSHRHHEETAAFRRAARVFVKPRTRPSDPVQFVESLKEYKNQGNVEAVALLVQNLLIDTSGRVVPSPLFNEVQFRFFSNDSKTGAITAELQHLELSRRKLLTEPASGGLVEYSPASPSYLASAGNDYDFATPIQQVGAPVLAPLRTRCAQCHGAPLTILMTYSIHYIPPVPTVRILSDHERALYVARRKEEHEDFRSLSATR